MDKTLDSLTTEAINGINETDLMLQQDLGLWKGAMGKIILLKILYDFTADKKWADLTEELLNFLASGIDSVEKTGFGEGLAGIGWGLEWLSQSGYLKVNTDIFLEDFDDILYKVVLFAPDHNLSLKDGALGKMAYFLKRYESKNPSSHRYRTICHQECLVILSDEIKGNIDRAIEKAQQPGTEWMNQIEDLSDSLIFLSRFCRHKVNTTVVEETIYAIIGYTRKLLEFIGQKDSVLPDAPQLQGKLLKLAYGYHYAGIKLNCLQWSREGLNRFRTLPGLFEQPMKETQRIETLPIYNRLYRQTQKKEYLDDLISGIKCCQLSGNSWSGQCGWPKLLLISLSCLHPGFISWDEAYLYS